MGEAAKERNAEGATRQPEGTKQYWGVPQWCRTHMAGETANQNRGPLPRRQDHYQQSGRNHGCRHVQLLTYTNGHLPELSPALGPGPLLSVRQSGPRPARLEGSVHDAGRDWKGTHTHTHACLSPLGCRTVGALCVFFLPHGHLTPSRHQTAYRRMTHKGGRYSSTREDLHVSPTGKSEPEAKDWTRTQSLYWSDRCSASHAALVQNDPETPLSFLGQRSLCLPPCDPTCQPADAGRVCIAAHTLPLRQLCSSCARSFPRRQAPRPVYLLTPGLCTEQVSINTMQSTYF